MDSGKKRALLAHMLGESPVRKSNLFPTLSEMLEMPADQLARLDLGFRNLLCAIGMPDTQELEIGACLAKLHQWVQHVKRETERNLHRFQKHPSEYQNSEEYFRVGMMITVLQQDYGVQYDPACIETQKFSSSGEGFIHGILNGQGGTCTNLPVLYAAVARKLGYPVYICCAKRHLFNRWASSDGRVRFNFEGSGLGFGVFDDEYYANWPGKIEPHEIEQGFYLRNLDPAEEVAEFMATRGHCLLDRGQVLDAIVAYAHAHRLGKCQPPHFYCLMEAINQELRLHAEGKLPNSYRQWECWDRIPRPQRVLKANFKRLDKARPVFRPIQAIVTDGFLKGDRP